jgi:hypothetical protein
MTVGNLIAWQIVGARAGTLAVRGLSPSVTKATTVKKVGAASSSIETIGVV